MEHASFGHPLVLVRREPPPLPSHGDGCTLPWHTRYRFKLGLDLTNRCHAATRLPIPCFLFPRLVVTGRACGLALGARAVHHGHF